MKCLHAQLADELLSRDNAVGRAVLDGLEARGVDPAGSETCAASSAPAALMAGGTRPPKNKQKLRAARARHKKLRELARGLRHVVRAREAARGGRGGGAGEELILGADGGLRVRFGPRRWRRH